MVSSIKTPPIYKIALSQLLVTFILSLALMTESVVYGYSALLGGLVCIGPSAYFARFVFKYSGAKSTARVARSFYLGEAGKFLLTAVLFAVIFITVEPLSAGILFLSYGIAVFVGLITGHLIIGR